MGLFDTLKRWLTGAPPGEAPRNAVAPAAPASGEDRHAQLYLYAHRALPQFGFSGGAQFFDDLCGAEGPRMLEYLWRKVEENLGAAGRPAPLAWAPLATQVLHLEAGRACLITLPEPREVPEAYFVAFVSTPEGLRYFTLEYGSDMQGGVRTVLCSWSAEGTHANYGNGPAPTAEAFASAINALLVGRAG